MSLATASPIKSLVAFDAAPSSATCWPLSPVAADGILIFTESRFHEHH